jgi:hypothetical protein
MSDRIIDRVAKLLKLSKSDNVHEAAAAAAMAQSLIDRNKLDIAVVELAMMEGDQSRPAEPVQTFQDPLCARPQKSTWVGRLGLQVSRANDCVAYWAGGGAMKLMGRPSDAETCRYMFAYLVNEIERLTAANTRGEGRTWKNNFRLGAVDAITAKLKEQRRQTRETFRREALEKAGSDCTALVRVDTALARMEARLTETEDSYRKTFSCRKTFRSANDNFNYNGAAREAGRKAGEGIVLGGRTRAALGA